MEVWNKAHSGIPLGTINNGEVRIVYLEDFKNKQDDLVAVL